MNAGALSDFTPHIFVLAPKLRVRTRQQRPNLPIDLG